MVRSRIQPSLDLPRHGGDLASAEARFGRPAEGWLDLSTGINPYPYPLPELSEQVWHRLPDRDAEAALIAAASDCYGVADPAMLVAAPGSQALIQWLPRLMEPSRVTVVGPTYAEHAAAWTSAGHEVEVADGETVHSDSRVVVLVNPNNPDGHRYAPEGLLDLAAALHRRHGLLVVDEAFADVAPELSLAGRVVPGLVILRSVGKFFGLAGLRLGFAVSAPEFAARLRSAIGPWAISGAALSVGTVALADMGWIAGMRRRLRADAVALDEILNGAGLAVSGGTDLFRLAIAPRAWMLYDHLGQRGVLVRPFAEQARWLRFGLPGGTVGRERLRRALADWSG